MYSEEDLNKIISIIPIQLIVKLKSNREQGNEAIKLSKKYNIPAPNALHFVLARDNGAILITRDKHLLELPEEIDIKKPEDLI